MNQLTLELSEVDGIEEMGRPSRPSCQALRAGTLFSYSENSHRSIGLSNGPNGVTESRPTRTGLWKGGEGERTGFQSSL